MSIVQTCCGWMSSVLLVTQGRNTSTTTITKCTIVHECSRPLYHRVSFISCCPLLWCNKLPTLLLSQQFAMARPSPFRCVLRPSVVQHAAALKGKRIVNRQWLINHITQRSHQPSLSVLQLQAERAHPNNE